MILKLSMQHQGLKFYKVYINGDSWLTLTYFMPRSNLVINLGFSIGKSETVGACDLTVGRCKQLIELMRLCEF